MDDFETAYNCADNCDTCWWLCSTEAFERLGDDVIAVKLRTHLSSGHLFTSTECEVYWWKCPKCEAQHGTPTSRQETCRNCGTKMVRKKLKDL